MSTTKDTNPTSKVPQKPECEAQGTDNPLLSIQNISTLYAIQQREKEIKAIWGLEWRAYSILLEVVHNWQVEGKASTVFGLANGRDWSLCTLIRTHIGNLAAKGLVYYFGKAGAQNNPHGKLWAPTAEALKIFGICETFTDVCA